jgi:hypothetical protein
MYMQRTLLVLLVSLTVLGVLIGGYLFFSFKSAMGPSSDGPDLRGQALFSDGEYGLSIQFPEEKQTDFNFSPFSHLPARWRVNALSNGTGTPVIAIVGYRTESDHAYPRYYDAEVRIGVSKDPVELARCEKPSTEQSEEILPDVILGGTTFKVFSFRDAGMMQYLKGVSYRALHEGACVAIEQVATGSSYRDGFLSKEDISDVVLEKAYSDLANIVSTFAFARP